MLIVANWKLHFNNHQAQKWLEDFAKHLPSTTPEVEVVICPSFTLLSELNQSITLKSLRLQLGAQNVSFFEEGAYTGEVSAFQIAEWAKYVIIGHSERRALFKEFDDLVVQKAQLSLKWALSPIICVSKIDQVKSLTQLKGTSNKLIVAYEPLFAIGSGITEDPNKADFMANQIRSVLGNNITILYGGSVDENNVEEFLGKEHLQGFLVGGTSLDPMKFSRIVEIINSK